MAPVEGATVPDFGFSAEQQALREHARDLRERAVLPFLRAREFDRARSRDEVRALFKLTLPRRPHPSSARHAISPATSPATGSAGASTSRPGPGPSTSNDGYCSPAFSLTLVRDGPDRLRTVAREDVR